MPSQLKRRVLETADRLFYAQGVRAVGIDRIIDESGIAKASFYRFFASKDMLIAAWMQMRDEAWRTWFVETVEALAPDPANRPLAIFDALYAQSSNPGFRGCPFINTIVELPAMEHPAAQAARAHKAAVQELIRSYLDGARCPSTLELSAAFMQLVDGALVTSMREGRPDPVLRARDMAKMLMAACEHNRQRPLG